MKTMFITMFLVSALGAISQAHQQTFQFEVATIDGTTVLTLDSAQSISLINLLRSKPGNGFTREASAEIKCVQSNPTDASCWVVLPQEE